MPVHSPLFAQVVGFLDPTEFARCAQPFAGARVPRGPSAYDHFLCLCFYQLTQRQSLRDLVQCLAARPRATYHLGLRSRITRSGLAYATQHRPWQMFAAAAQVLMRRASRLYEHPSTDALPDLAFALDSSLIDLSLALFPWARLQSGHAAVKLHTLLSLHSALPTWVAVSEAKQPDSFALDHVPKLPGAFYVMDRGYLDFSRLAPLHTAGAFFVVRNKCHVNLRRIESRPVDKTTGLRCDQTVRLSTNWSRRFIDFPLRRIGVRNLQHGFSLVLLTNNFELPATTLSLLYQRRWEVELFFRWIKQHLRLSHFMGRSPNAVRCQIWSAICVHLLVAIAKKSLHLPQSLHQILQILSVCPFEQITIQELLATTPLETPENQSNNQFTLNGL
jgi:hypothetical protein